MSITPVFSGDLAPLLASGPYSTAAGAVALCADVVLMTCSKSFACSGRAKSTSESVYSTLSRHTLGRCENNSSGRATGNTTTPLDIAQRPKGESWLEFARPKRPRSSTGTSTVPA
eukprot:scaffold11126_cov64-Phaeocystis_antarctica.AAC.7